MFQCESVLEQNENDIEDWYWHHQDIPLKFYLCKDRFLKGQDSTCLDEKFIKGDTGKGRKKGEKKKKDKKAEEKKEEL